MQTAMVSRNQLPVIAALFSVCWLLAGTDYARARTEPCQVKIDTGTSYQTIDGFGASDAWQCAIVGKNWPLEKRERKLLWVLGNYARFIRPGMARVKCAVEPEQSYVNGVLASAYKAV